MSFIFISVIPAILRAVLRWSFWSSQLQAWEVITLLPLGLVYCHSHLQGTAKVIVQK